jgi:hypothetical protein
MLLASLCILVLLGSTAFAVAGYYGAQDAKNSVEVERTESVLRNCERGNSTNRGVLNFIDATLQGAPLMPVSTGNPDVDRAVVGILNQVNNNSKTRNEAIANAQKIYFPLVNCKTGKTLPLEPSTTSLPSTSSPPTTVR